jgi:hypothetical protein
MFDLTLPAARLAAFFRGHLDKDAFIDAAYIAGTDL